MSKRDKISRNNYQLLILANSLHKLRKIASLTISQIKLNPKKMLAKKVLEILSQIIIFLQCPPNQSALQAQKMFLPYHSLQQILAIKASLLKVPLKRTIIIQMIITPTIKMREIKKKTQI